MSQYDRIRAHYRPRHIKILLIAESPPPVSNVQSSRHFYRTDVIRTDDRLFTNTIKALYDEAAKQTEAELQSHKAQWLQKFAADGFYMIEALPTSLPHEITKPGRQARILQELPQLVKRVRALADGSTKLILIKSNVFEVAATPLRHAGFTVLNTELVDYPGQYNQRAYRQKLAALVAQG